MCYSSPTLTDKDKQWDGSESDLISRTSARSAPPNLVAGSTETEASEIRFPERPEKRRRTEAAAKQRPAKLSTAVNLLPAATSHKQTKAVNLEVPDAILHKDMASLPDAIQQYMRKQGFTDPMPIQQRCACVQTMKAPLLWNEVDLLLLRLEHLSTHTIPPTNLKKLCRCWPPLLKGKDVQAVAEPGSGKTLAYLLPCIPQLLLQGHGITSKPAGPLVLLLMPTRELAQQVHSASKPLRPLFGLRTALLTGGADRDKQASTAGRHWAACLLSIFLPTFDRYAGSLVYQIAGIAFQCRWPLLESST